MINLNKKYIFLLIIIIILISFFLILHNDLYVDENPHYAQIKNFTLKNYEINPDLTTIPGFHYLYYSISVIFNYESIIFFRTISLFISFLTIFIFYLITKEIKSKNKTNKTIQFIFMPILFVFFFLIYTDILSLLIVLTSILFALKNKINLTAFFGIISMLIRQNNIIWLFLSLIILIINNKDYLIFLKNNQIKIIALINLIKKYFFFGLSFILFILFVLINKGVAMGDKNAHPSVSINLGNLYFMLFLFFFVFLIYNFYNLRDIINNLKNNKIKYIILFIIIYIFFIFTFINNHPYNIDWGDYFIRNKILIFFSSSLLLKTIFFIPIILSVYSLFKMKFYFNKYFLFILSILYLIPSWLIEQRYYIIPFTLFIIFLKEDNKIINHIQSVYIIIINFIVFYLIIFKNIFL
jgi:alpha-1,2-glucosyltransferase